MRWASWTAWRLWALEAERAGETVAVAAGQAEAGALPGAGAGGPSGPSYQLRALLPNGGAGPIGTAVPGTSRRRPRPLSSGPPWALVGISQRPAPSEPGFLSTCHVTLDEQPL